MTILRERPLLFYTSHISYTGEDRVSVARQRFNTDTPEGLAFAPSWTILAPAIKLRQAGLETDTSWTQYVALYTAEMRQSYQGQPEAWKALLAQSRAVLCCFCDLRKHPRRCHRLLLAKMLKRCGAVYLGELVGNQSAKWPTSDSDSGPNAGRRLGQLAHWLDLGDAEGGAW